MDYGIYIFNDDLEHNNSNLIKLIILITNKMKIIMRLSLINTLVNTHRYCFSNLIKDNPLSIDDLVINPAKNKTITSSSNLNKSKALKVSSEAINAEGNKVKIN